MTNCDVTVSAPILVAIDISKERHEVLIQTPGKERRRRVSVFNNLGEFDRLINLLRSYQRPVHVAFEATGNYHRTLAYQIGFAGFEIKFIFSVALARTREALHNFWDKNDPKDVQVILHMMTIGAEQFYHDPLMHGTNDIQELSKTHDMASKSKTKLWHRILTYYLPLYFSEAGRFHCSSRSDWFFAFLELSPSPHFIAALGKQEFIEAAWEVV